MARLAGEQNTIVTARQLYACGLSSGAITLRTRRGTLHRVHRGVYSVVREDSLTMKARLTAAVLACGDGAVLSHRSAGAWWGLIAFDERHPEVTAPRDGGRAIDGIRARRTRGLDSRDVWRREHIRVTSPARTALDIASDMPRPALRRLLRQAQAEGRLTVNQLHDVVSRANGHHGAGALRAVIADGPAPTRSVAEDLLLDLLDEAALPRPELNPRLALGDTTIMPDFLWREQMLVVEVDGAQFHSSAQARHEDAVRQALLEARGHRVIRVTYHQLVQHPEQTVARIRLALYDRGR